MLIKARVKVDLTLRAIRSLAFVFPLCSRKCFQSVRLVGLCRYRTLKNGCGADADANAYANVNADSQTLCM